MKTLIAYASKTGTSKKCAELLGQALPDSELCDLTKEKRDPASFDAVVIGGGIRMGRLHVDARQYLEYCKELLLTKRLGLFLCSGWPEQAEAQFSGNVDGELLAHATVRMSFGGEIDMQRMHGFDRLLARMAQKAAREDPASAPRLYPERIDAFAKAMAGKDGKEQS